MRMSAPENRNPDLSTVSPQHQVCTLETSTSDLGPQGTFFMPERWLWIVPRGRRRGTDDRVPAVAEGMSADHQGAQSQSQPRLVLGFRASLPLTLQVNLMLVLLTLLTFIHPFLVNRECQGKESPREVA